MKRLVIDACLALGFILPDEQEKVALLGLSRLEGGQDTHVPSHWVVEVTNGILMAERRKRLTQSQAIIARQLIAALPVQMDELSPLRSMSDVSALARQFGLTSYDAAYLELAIRLDAELATTDRALIKAAKKVGVSTL
jgi:predicted nucleic acid-binding protein